jgi:cell division protease FtsH
VAGVEEAKNDLVEVVDFLKHPEKYHKMGARAPKGVLLVGPAGVGKTLLARAVAGEANVPFYSMAGSEFMEMLVGVGASRVRDLFGTAKKAGKAIIFIDEIDAIGRMRGGIDGGHGEREQTLNQILVEMDGFDVNTAVVVLAATNRGDLLDPALMRPGRFDRRVILEMPDLKAREEIIKIHARGKPFTKGLEWATVARRTVGFSGADLENMLNEAAIKAARENKTEIEMVDIEEAALKVKLGSEKRRELTDEDKLMTAYHEAGHAVVNYKEGLDPVHRISIVSRGMALGFTLIPPKIDRVHETKSRLIKQMAMAMGGRAAEDIVFKDVTSGAASDITQVTNIARNMVIEWGMSDLGPINLGPQIDVSEFGRAYFEPAKISEGMQGKVDEEIKKLVDTALARAQEILKKNRKKLDELAKLLVEKESLDDKEFEAFMK